MATSSPLVRSQPCPPPLQHLPLWCNFFDLVISHTKRASIEAMQSSLVFDKTFYLPCAFILLGMTDFEDGKNLNGDVASFSASHWTVIIPFGYNAS
ncbi:hypothetical protein RHMOL_Rhmol02G0252000 [Rhododendron molle]|uniref:Uncharacterized protein n=1 Tax=Rhododendron molle TaxID=49168 RepID=A0ACC0PX22_RHOML|nr:hypothetical protein RHMOL_Rhmol02G0252000 [Rhododendron molle]